MFVMTMCDLVATEMLPLSRVHASGPAIIWSWLKTPAFRQKHFWRLVISIASYKPVLDGQIGRDDDNASFGETKRQ